MQLITKVRLFLVAACVLCVDARAQEPAVRKLKYSGGQMELLVNSTTLSQAVAINSAGSIVGTREIPDKSAGLLLPVPFYLGKYGAKDIPTPESFTNLEPIGICDTELVIAYATRPAGNQNGSLLGVIWDPKDGSFVYLPKAPGDTVHQPQSVSADGKRITGYTTGPDRLRPAVWDWKTDSQSWSITVLPTEHANNPYLMSGGLMISPNGKWVAGCCTKAFLPDGSVDSALYLWTELTPGNWRRKLLSDEQLYLRGMNDQGEMAGSIRGQTGARQPCYVSPQGEFRVLELFPGDSSGEAKGISNDSIVVGFSDDPPGKIDAGPEPCYWSKDGKIHKLAPETTWYGMTQAINQSGQMAGMVEDSQTGAAVGFRTLK